MFFKKKFDLPIKIVFSVVVALSVVLTALRIFMIATSYEAPMYAFAHGAVLPVIYNYTVFGVVLLLFVLFFFAKSEGNATELVLARPMTVVFAAATGFLSLVGGLYAISKITATSDNVMMQMMQTPEDQRLNAFVKIQCVLSLAVFAYFMLTAFSIGKHAKIKSVLGILTILWHVVFLLVIYFDMSKPINSPIKMMFQFAVLVSMIFMVYELRFLLGMARPRMYMATALASIVVISSAAIPMTIGAFAGYFNVTVSNLIYSLQLVAMLGYIISRFVTYINYNASHKNTTKEEN